MMEMTTTGPATAMNETEFQQYRPLFGPAVVTFALGLLSSLALIPWTAFLILPLAAVLTGLWSLVRLRRVTGESTGHRGMLRVILLTLLAVALAAMANGDAIAGFIAPAMRSMRAPVRLLGATFLSGQYVIVGLMGVSLVLAVFGLARLPRISSSAVSGDRLIRLGVTIALVFGAGGTINHQVPRQALIRSAAETGHVWLSSMATGQFEKVIILYMHPVSRPPQTTNLESLIQDRDMRDAFNILQEEPIVQTMTALGPETKIVLDGVEEVLYRGNGSEVQAAYRVIVPPKDGQASASYFLVALQMIVDTNRRTGVREWRIYEHQAPYTRGGFRLPERSEGHGHNH